MARLDAFELAELRVNGARLVYACAGSGPALVLVHGLSGSMRWWAHNARVLAQNHTVYLVDLPGFGRSSGQPFALAQMPGLLLSWLDGLEIASFSLVGHSMGGTVCAQMAAAFPDRVRKLVLVDAVTQPLRRSLLGSLVKLFPAARYMAPSFYPVLAYDALRAGPAALLRASLDLHDPRLSVDLAAVAARTLLVWGEHDRLIPAAAGEQAQKMLPRSEFALVPGAGHCPMWDRPEEFNRVILGFL